MLTGRTESSETVHHQIMNLTNLTFIKEPDGLPVKIRFDETSQFAAGSANVSVTTFLSSLQKRPKTGSPRDTRF